MFSAGPVHRNTFSFGGRSGAITVWFGRVADGRHAGYGALFGPGLEHRDTNLLGQLAGFPASSSAWTLPDKDTVTGSAGSRKRSRWLALEDRGGPDLVPQGQGCPVRGDWLLPDLLRRSVTGRTSSDVLGG